MLIRLLGIHCFFWDAIYIGGIGDVSNMLKPYNSGALRVSFVVISGAFMFLRIIIFNVLYMKRITAWLVQMGKASRIK